ncbi:subtilisin-like serine protease [Leptothrix ochracea L12]|uniref:Subtilisin-like serine protease n=1 Tax=Leptothrix ochracea L12 TaxID=735332 RepID=I4Z5C9_9BURK|nr:S8 family serine peptidase [Leptothrix ochracea]EIM31421.1 subtilisin-like serine protease [Leptothrix ochracea L12]
MIKIIDDLQGALQKCQFWWFKSLFRNLSLVFAICGMAFVFFYKFQDRYGDTQNMAALQQLAVKHGSVRIIVGVRVTGTPEGALNATGIGLQRKRIAAMQSEVLHKVASLKMHETKPKLFAIIPFMAVEASPDELIALSNLNEVISIEEDRVGKLADAGSVAVTGSSIAWSMGFSGIAQSIAILDSGVDKLHPFLAGKVVSEACFSTNNAADGATSLCPGGVAQSIENDSAMPYSGACPVGACGHGTAVAGIAAGTNATFTGIAKDAVLIAIQVFSRFDSVVNCGSTTPCVLTYTSDQIMGLEQVYALRNTYNIAAVNMSLGGGRYFSQATCDATNAAIKSIIDTLRSVNIPTIIASGNDGFVDSMDAPACISSAISVGATFSLPNYNNNCAGNNVSISSIDSILCESNSAPFINLLAPGAVITSSVPGGDYLSWYGTSMAAPQVAGAWAIMKQKKFNLTVSDGLGALTLTGVPITDPRNNLVTPRIQVNTVLNAI